MTPCHEMDAWRIGARRTDTIGRRAALVSVCDVKDYSCKYMIAENDIVAHSERLKMLTIHSNPIVSSSCGANDRPIHRVLQSSRSSQLFFGSGTTDPMTASFQSATVTQPTFLLRIPFWIGSFQIVHQSCSL